MTILVTGAAGFIGSHVSKALLDRGDRVLGIDNLNDYYDPSLKQARLKHVIGEGRSGFEFRKIDISDTHGMEMLRAEFPGVDRIVHLAAQAGVRYSLINPHAYIQSNVLGHLNILEWARHSVEMKHCVYASSSSVYGGNKKLPFSVDDRVDNPISLYAATKKSDELISHSYSHLYRIPTTGLRFFTVYGPWGRPDMAAYIFTKAIFEGRKIPVFNNGDMRRDFTYIDDIVKGIVSCLDNPPEGKYGEPPYKVYNIGNNQSEPLMRMIGLIESATNLKAEIDFQPMQPGDVKETYADIEPMRRDFGFEPSTPIDVGIPKFVEWYRSYHGL